MDRNYILRELRKEIRRSRKGLCKGTRDYMRWQSYRKWAVNEILDSLANYDADIVSDYYDILDDFVRKMDEYSCSNTPNSIIFAVAKDTGEWILDILLSIDYTDDNNPIELSEDDMRCLRNDIEATKAYVNSLYGLKSRKEKLYL